MPTMDPASWAMVVVAVVTVVGNYLITRRKGRIDLDLERYKSAQAEAKDLMDRLLTENRELRHKSRNQDQRVQSLAQLLEAARRASEERQAQIAELRKQMAVMHVRMTENKTGLEEVKEQAAKAEQVAIDAIKAAEKASDPDCP